MEIQYGGHVPSNLDFSSLPGMPADLRMRGTPVEEDRELLKKPIMFFQAAYFLSKESEAAGYPKFETRDYVKVIISEVETFVTDLPFVIDKFGNKRPHWKRSFWINKCRSVWDRYEKTASGEIGTPLSFIPGADLSTMATLQMAGVKTAEQIVGLAGEALERIPGALALREKAHSYLDSTRALQLKTDEIEGVKAQRDEALKLLAEYKAKIEQDQDNGNNFADSSGRSEQGESKSTSSSRRK
jgi:hypothetical protein